MPQDAVMGLPSVRFRTDLLGPRPSVDRVHGHLDALDSGQGCLEPAVACSVDWASEGVHIDMDTSDIDGMAEVDGHIEVHSTVNAVPMEGMGRKQHGLGVGEDVLLIK